MIIPMTNAELQLAIDSAYGRLRPYLAIDGGGISENIRLAMSEHLITLIKLQVARAAAEMADILTRMPVVEPQPDVTGKYPRPAPVRPMVVE